MRRKASNRVPWAPVPVDAGIDEIAPYPGWVLLEEEFLDTTRTLGDVSIVIARPYDNHTTFGRVKAINELDAAKLGVVAGNLVVYREWSGGRWLFNGVSALIAPIDAILGIVEGESSE